MYEIIAKGIFVFIVGCLFQWLILRQLKQLSLFQQIYELSPETHQAKSATPSFGGVGVYLTVTLGLVVFQLFSTDVLWCFSVFTLFFAIGLLDDLLSLMKRNNKGFTAKRKFFLQTFGASFFLAVSHVLIAPITWPLFFVYLFLIVGSSNASNLTDGVDGLLAVLGSITCVAFIIYFGFGHSISTFSLVIILSLLSFFIFNKHPAKIFMGDTGSLALGAVFASFTVIAQNPWPLLSFGGIYVIETLSVILQVFSYKCFKKRVFLMSPLHHHFELLGFSEWSIVGLFSFIASVLTLIYFL